MALAELGHVQLCDAIMFLFKLINARLTLSLLDCVVFECFALLL
jgi:hypothetical protein